MVVYYFLVDKATPNSSKVFPLVSGITNSTNSSCKNIINAKKAKTYPGPIVENRNGIKDGINAAKTQCVDDPKDCPEALK